MSLAFKAHLVLSLCPLSVLLEVMHCDSGTEAATPAWFNPGRRSRCKAACLCFVKEEQDRNTRQVTEGQEVVVIKWL